MRTVKPQTGLKGIDKVLGNLNRELIKIKARSLSGMIEAGMFIQQDMEDTPPLIPVDTNNLRQSWFSNPIPGKEPGLLMGFTANYAAFVHEMVDADFTSPRKRYVKGKKPRWYVPRPGAGAKFFESALKRNRDKILQIIGREAKIK